MTGKYEHTEKLLNCSCDIFLCIAVLLAYVNRVPAHVDSDFVAVLIPNIPVSNDVLLDLFAYVPNLSQQSQDSITFALGYNPNYRTITTIKREMEKVEIERLQCFEYVLSSFIDSALLDSAYVLLQAENNYEADITLASLYYENLEYEEAQSLLNGMDYSDADFENWRDLFQLQLDLVEDGRSFFEMDENEYAFVEGLATSGTCELSNAQAQSIMTYVTWLDYETCSEESGGRPSTTYANGNDNYSNTLSKINENGYLKVIPNPFSSSAVISYNIPIKSSNPRLFLYNNTGQLIKEFKISSDHGTIQISKKDLKTGIYLLSLTSDEQRMNVKIIIN